MTECGYNMSWGGICKEPRADGAEVCAKHLGSKCSVCGGQATHECNHHLGNFGCYAPLCAKHQDGDHHPDDKAWKEWLKTDQGKELYAKAGGLGGFNRTRIDWTMADFLCWLVRSPTARENFG